MSVQETSSPQILLPLSTGGRFYLFNRLPFELRRSVWKLCRPHRVIDIDLPPDPVDLETVCKGLEITRTLNSRTPIITRVCRESRAVAFERDTCINKNKVDQGLAPGFGNSTDFTYRDWFNPYTDIINLNWNPDVDYVLLDDFGDEIPGFLRVAAQSIGASITAGLLGGFDIGPSPSYPPFNWDRYRYFEMLESRNDYLVTLENVILHVSIDDALASGLFGRLGEERVKSVSTADEEVIQKYHRLWLAGPPEDQEPKRFFQEATESMSLRGKVEKWKYETDVWWLRFKCDQAIRHGVASREDLGRIWYKTIGPIDFEPETYAEGPGANWSGIFDENHPFAKKVLEDMPRFSPVIMFRLCEMKCYNAN